MHDQLSTGTIPVETLQPGDIEAMQRFHARVWLATFATSAYGLDHDTQRARLDSRITPEEQQRIRQALQEDPVTAQRSWFVAKDTAGSIIGLARPCRADEEGLQRVGALYVAPEYHGQGVADSLMDRVISWADPSRPLYLWVAVHNERAKRFYDRRGFEAVQGPAKLVYDSVPHMKMIRQGAAV